MKSEKLIVNEELIHDWLNSFAATAEQANLGAHMAHISHQVEVLGVPGFEVVSYEDWHRQCREEFPQKLIRSVNYSNMKVRELGADFVVFVVHEEVVLNDGGNNPNTVEMRLQLEGDRLLLRKLRILPPLESLQYMN